jgi:hypothetical protein
MSPRRQLFHMALLFLSSLLILNIAEVLRFFPKLSVTLGEALKNGSAATLDVPDSDSIRFCGRRDLVFPSEAESAQVKSSSFNRTTTAIPVDYQCSGEAYENYTNHYLQPYARSAAGMIDYPLTWGRRPFPLPSEVSVLVLGNSHTKQTVISLLCQYADVVQSVTPLGPSDINPQNISFFFEVRFLNNASMVFLGNHPLVYSRTWSDNIRRFDPQRRSLQDYDVVVLGQFNLYDPKYRNSLMFSMILSFQRRFPDLVNVEHDPCPSLTDLARQYNKSIVVMPMFAGFSQTWTERAIQEVQWLRSSQNRSNIGVIHTRGHIRAMGTECGSSAERTSIGTCIANSGAHRCTGPNGGDADLMAWDLVESFYSSIH